MLQANKALPNNPELNLVHGHALKTIGDVDDAIAAYQNLIHQTRLR